MKSWLLLLTLFGALALNGQDSATINQKDGLALEGYDLVSYFRGTAIRGSPEWEASHQGVAYRFTSERNLHLFQADPDRYLPAYGGWCAYAMGKSGNRVPVDPRIFKLVGGRLLLFNGSGLTNALKKWNKQEDKLLRMADANWDKTSGN